MIGYATELELEEYATARGKTLSQDAAVLFNLGS